MRRPKAVIKDWSKFDYITVEPPTYVYIILVIVMASAQTGYWMWAFKNRMDKLEQEDAIDETTEKQFNP